MHPDAIDRVLRKYAKAIGLDRGYSAQVHPDRHGSLTLDPDFTVTIVAR